MSIRRMTVLIVLLLLASAACSGESRPPVSPSPPPPPVTPSPPTPVVSTISGSIVATNGGQPLGGVTVTVSGIGTTTADGGGQFSFTAPTTTASAAIELTGVAIVPRRLLLGTRTRSVSLDAIQLLGGFSLPFYRQFVRNAHAQPGDLQPLRRITENPRVYLHTVFGANRAIDTSTLDMTASAITSAVSDFSGGRMSVALIERGAEARPLTPGWITVTWNEGLGDGICGRAAVGAELGRIELNPRNDGCRCPGDPGQVSRSVVTHEVGHSMGFWHTDSREDAMFDTFNSCLSRVSSRERLHAAIAYSRPRGNVDPDTDPSNVVALLPSPMLVR